MILPDSKDIKQIRKYLRMTQKELGKKVNITQSTLSRIENNSMDPPYSKMKKIILFLYNKNPEIFFTNSELIKLLSNKLKKCQSPIERIFYVYAFDKIKELVPQFQIDKIHVDFAIPPLKIAIECDGKEHHSEVSHRNKDNWRDAFLRSRGWVVQRFTGNDIITNIDWCIKRVIKIINHRKEILLQNNYKFEF